MPRDVQAPAKRGVGEPSQSPEIEYERSDAYAYKVAWSGEDGERVGVCAEKPSLSRLAPESAR